jgi:mannose-6-phosphate isomerase-like protein (cupin superfamily)
VRTIAFATLVLLVGSFIAFARDTDPPGQDGTYVSAGELASKVAQTVTGIGYQIPSSPGYKVLMIQRDKTGDAEVHTEMNDTIIVEQGRGRFLIGGQITGNHLIRPNEWRGGDMNGAREYDVSVGDLLLIPAGMPHKAILTSGTFTYLTIKTPRQHAVP